VRDSAVFSLRLGDIVEAIGGELLGDAQIAVEGLAPLDRAQPRQICFLSNPRYAAALPECLAACVIVAPSMRDAALARGTTIVVPDPYLYYAKLTQLWRRRHGEWKGDDAAGRGGWIHPSAVVHPQAEVHPSARIGPLCVVERGARVGAGSELTSRVGLGYDCIIGERCIVHPGVVIGADGFGFAKDGDRWEKIEQLGAVWIGNDVEIGANTCIDRGALSDTVIEDGVKLDNLIQIGHNVRIGRNTAIAGSVAVAGSATIYPVVGASANRLPSLGSTPVFSRSMSTATGNAMRPPCGNSTACASGSDYWKESASHDGYPPNSEEIAPPVPDFVGRPRDCAGKRQIHQGAEKRHHQ